MPPAASGAIAGVFAAVILTMVFVEGAGAASALLLPLYALLLAPVGALLGWALGRAVRALRKGDQTS